MTRNKGKRKASRGMKANPTSAGGGSKDPKGDEPEIHLGEEETYDDGPRQKKYELCCSHPNNNEIRKFKISVGPNPRNEHFDIISSPPADYVVERYNSSPTKAILDFTQFNYTLDRWLEGRNKSNNLVKTFKLPTNDTRKLIHAIIKALCKFQETNDYHGALQNAENYGIQHVKNFEEAHPYDDFRVTILYRSMVGANEGKDMDIMALNHIIFDCILPLKNYKDYHQDLQDLYNLTQDASRAVENMWLIASHPSLWTPDKRLNFYGKVWTKYDHGETSLRNLVSAAIGKVDCSRGWKGKIKTGTPFYRVFESNHYKEQPYELLRYIRIVIQHINEEDKNTRGKLYLILPKDRSYTNMEFVEFQISLLFPGVLVSLWAELHKAGVEI